MTGWSVDPVGGWWFYAAVAALLLLVLVATRSTRTLSRRRRIALFALRGATLLLLLFVLLRPTHVTTEIERLPGSLVLLVDSSRSMQVEDSLGGKSRFDAAAEVLQSAGQQLAKLAETWELRYFRFDEQTDLLQTEDGLPQLPDQPTGGQTALGAALEDTLAAETQGRIVAVVLLSDGAQRAFAPRDAPPQTIARRLADENIPLYTLAFGRPALGLESDLRVEDLLVPETTFADAPIAIDAVVGANGYANQTFKVQLLWERSDGAMEAVDTQRLLVKNDQSQYPLTFTYTPTEPGEYKVTVEVESPEGELVTSNNRQSSFVRVLEGGVRVLYLAGASRVGGSSGLQERFVRTALASHADMSVDYDLFDYRQPRLDYRDRLEESHYDVFVLGNVDFDALDTASWKAIAKRVASGAGLVMLGGYHSFGPGGFFGSPLENALPVRMGRAERQRFGEPPRQDVHVDGPLRLIPASGPTGIHPILQIAGTTAGEFDWRSLPALDGANMLDRRRVKPNAQVIAESDGPRRWPLLVVGAWGEGRTAALAVDSTWRWQLEGFGDLHRRFWRQLMLWLARKDDTSGEQVWLRLEARRYQRGSTVNFTCGGSSSEGAPLPEATFEVAIELPDGTTLPLSTTARGERHVGKFEQTDMPGDYRIWLSATAGGESLGTASARFTVPDLDMELDQPAAEPTLLASLAGMTADAGGRGLAPEDFPTLLEELSARTEEFEEEISREVTLWDTWPTLLLLVGLLSTEWLLRKRWGLV